jgi:hypothetical protein
MRPRSIILALLLAVGVLLVIRWRGTSESDRPHLHQTPAGPDISPVCPWREPQRDLLALFPPATNYVTETRIVSRVTVEIERRLGRHMNSDEKPPRVHRVLDGERQLGSVLVTRVKGEHGGIEIITGVETNGAVRGVLIQSQREPETVAEIITGTQFLSAFVGKTAASPLRLGEDLPAVRAEARASAQAIADGVRGQLIVLSFAELPMEIRELGTRTLR